MNSIIAFWSTLDGLVNTTRIIIDRPAGSQHPRYPDRIYPVDYGYLAGTRAMDGGGIDVWRGSATGQAIDAILCTVDRVKQDAEIKILIGCSEEEKLKILDFHNSSPHMQGILIRRPEA